MSASITDEELQTELVEGLPGIGVLTATADEVEPGQRFRPTDPAEEAHAHATPSGLLQEVMEDVEGVEIARPFGDSVLRRRITAIDAGVVKLGHTATGVVGVVRAAAVTYDPDGRTTARMYRPGIFAIEQSNRLRVLHGMGRELGRADFFVKVDDSGEPTEEKMNLGVHDHRLLDRARNYVERLVQRDVCAAENDATVMIDGALTLRTYDTPKVFLTRLHEMCEDRDVSLVAVSKKTGLTVRGVDIRLLLDQEGGVPARRRLTRALAADRGRDDRRFLGDLFVARFAPGGDTYRVDVDAAPGLIAGTVLDEVARGCLHRNGYPEPLILAHAFSYLPPPWVAQLQAHAIAAYGFVVQPEPRLGPVFAPFGGRYK